MEDPKCVEAKLRDELTEPAYEMAPKVFANIEECWREHAETLRRELDDTSEKLALRTLLLDGAREDLCTARSECLILRGQRAVMCRNFRCISILASVLIVVLLALLAVPR